LLRKTVSGIMLVLILIGVLTLTFNIQPVKSDWTWTGTIYIWADGSVYPDTAPISTVDNITYTLTDNIVGDVPIDINAIVIEKDHIVIEGAGYTVQGTGSGTGIYLSGRTNVTVQNTQINDFDDGVLLSDSSNNSISGNTVANNYDGIQLYGSSNNSISGNTVANNYDGIRLTYSSNNSISGNNITNNMRGIWLASFSNHNSISGNTFSNDGLVDNSLQNLVEDNTVNGKPLVYLDGVADYSVSNAGQVILVNCARIRVENLNLSKTAVGVQLSNTHNSIIAGNNIANNLYGIQLTGSSNNSVSGNNIANNGYAFYLTSCSDNSISGNNITNNDDGIWLTGSSNNNSVSGNNIANNGAHCIWLTGSSNNSVSGNNIANNGYAFDLTSCSDNSISGNNITNNMCGFYLRSCSNNSISGNNITANDSYGIQLYGSSNNSISGNTVANNYGGIWLSDSSNNTIYHNNFIDNGKQVDNYASTNVWDDGYPSGGNYWSDYSDVDEKSGPNQDQPGSDGIGDTPYVIDENNQDNYPLIPEHELVASITAPPSLQLGSSLSLNATVTNSGLNDESDVELLLAINGTILDSTTISLLQAGNLYTLSYLWTPTIEGTYNITAYVPPLPEERNRENNQATNVTVVTHLPVASFTYSPSAPKVGTTVTFNASASYDPDGSIISYEWNFGDGATDSGEIVTHTYTDPGTYTVTLTVTDNEDATDTSSLTVSPAPTYTVGVKAGDWIKCDYTVTGWPSGTPYPEWLKVEILSVEGTTASVRVTMHMSDGTEQSDTLSVDVGAGGETFDTLFGFVIPANCTTGDSIIMGGDGSTFNVTIDGETTGTYAGVSRTVVYASFSRYGTELTYYWDKETGVMVEASTTSGGITGTAKATETNMWEAEPIWMQWWLWAIVAIVIVALAAGTAYFLKRRRPTTVSPSLTKTPTDRD